ncbi:MAG: M23 family metallopeptidase [Angelakisella sp.]
MPQKLQFEEQAKALKNEKIVPILPLPRTLPPLREDRLKPLLRQYPAFTRLQSVAADYKAGSTQTSRLHFEGAERRNGKLQFENAGYRQSKLHFEGERSGGSKLHFEGEHSGASRLHFENGRRALPPGGGNAAGNMAASKSSGSASALRSKKKGFEFGRKEFTTMGSEASADISRLADQSENDGVRTADRGRVIAGRGYGMGRTVEKKFYRGKADAREIKRQGKKLAKELTRQYKAERYFFQHGRESPRELRRMKRRQMAQKASAQMERNVVTRAVKRTGALVVKMAKGTLHLVVAALSWIGLPVLGIMAAFMLLFGGAMLLMNLLTDAAVATFSAYTSEDAAIEAASLLATQLEAKLQQEIDGLPSAWEWGHIDEFRYDTDPIGHSPFELMGYLSVTNPGFDMGMLSPVPGVIRQLHEARYDLILEQQVETRYDTEISTDPVTGEETEHEVPYDYYILNVILRSKGVEEAVYNKLMQSPEQELWEWYKVLMETSGARQEFGNPFVGVDWRDRVTSLYGYRVNPLGGKNLQTHRGLDIVMPEGTPIAAGIAGTVRYVRHGDTTFGNYIILEDDKGVTMQYAHCRDIHVATGDSVAVGDDIATVGNTGASTGSHLHIEIKRDGKYINPIYALKFGGNEE